MASQNKLSFRIVNGPSKFDLMLSLFDGNQTPRRTVSFQLEGVEMHIPVAIVMIEQEDGSGESWNFKGQTRFEGAKGSFHIKGYFATKGRCGHLEFEIPFYKSWNQDSGQYDKVIDPKEQAEVEQFVGSLRHSLSRDFTDLIRNARRM